MLKNPKPAKAAPRPISRADFAALLAAAKDDVKWTAILLLSLNCGLYPVDVCRLRKDALNLEIGTLFDFRRKTGIARVAVLWPRTREALDAYLLSNRTSMRRSL